MARRWLLVLVATTGCRGLLGIEEPFVADAGGGTADAAPDAQCTRSSHRFDACALGTPLPALHLTSVEYTLDTTPIPAQLRNDKSAVPLLTTSLTFVQSDGQAAVILYVSALSVDSEARLKIVGARPAIIVAEEDIVISGALDAGSHLAELSPTTHVAANVQIGAGANQACTFSGGFAGGNGLPTAGSGGGGGGGGAGGGGTGGTGDGAMVLGGKAGTTQATPTMVRGGCAGGSSGTAGTGASSPATQATVSNGGAGGGAIHLAAFNQIRILGSVLAGGAGGAGSPQGAACGGGGGGSGGTIGLEAPVVMLENAQVAANGGGGGGGGLNAGFGANGRDGGGGTDLAPGGIAQSCGTAGGSGGAALLNGQSVLASDSCGGGGGGGGAGFVLIWTDMLAMTNGSISPAPRTDVP
ncbi:hypothetical protein BH11MYX3_BH11MYX3_38980 [soil metagenome]